MWVNNPHDRSRVCLNADHQLAGELLQVNGTRPRVLTKPDRSGFSWPQRYDVTFIMGLKVNTYTFRKGHDYNYINCNY